jgi:hypothetical protein
MAEGQSMTTVADLLAPVRDGRLEDFMREAVVLATRELMDAELSGLTDHASPRQQPEQVTWSLCAVSSPDPMTSPPREE